MREGLKLLRAILGRVFSRQVGELRPGLSSDIDGRRGVLASVVRWGVLKVGDLITFAQGEPAPIAIGNTLTE